MIRDEQTALLRGATVGQGRWRLDEALLGSLDESLWLARPDALITVGWSTGLDAADMRARLALPIPGVTPLLAVEPLDGHDREALIEALPGGAPSPTQAPDIATACHWGAAVAAIVATAHASGLALGGLRPEAVWIERGAVTTLAPRTTRFWELCANDMGVIQGYPSVILSPERLGGGGPSVADDLFALAVTVAIWATGRFPFAGDTRDAQVRGILLRDRVPLTGPPQLVDLLAASLGPASGRPSLTDAGNALDALARSLAPAGGPVPG